MKPPFPIFILFLYRFYMTIMLLFNIFDSPNSFHGQKSFIPKTYIFQVGDVFWLN